jgi:ATP-dependent Clp protease adapter protein ClpS
MTHNAPEIENDVTTGTSTGEPNKVILFNDEVHTFDEVIEQLILAIRCSWERANTLVWEVHEKGKACVYTGEMPDCLMVSSILESIGLHTQIEV